MNVIFLDLDGPAFSEVCIKFHPDNRTPYPGKADLYHPFCDYWRMDERFVHLFRHLHDVHDFKVVISSSWRKLHPDPFAFTDLFATNGLILNLHCDWKTESFTSQLGCTRAEEIVYWLKEHPEVSDFLILDDVLSGGSLYKDCDLWNPAHEFISDKIVLIDPDLGLGTMNILKIYDITKSW